MVAKLDLWWWRRGLYAHGPTLSALYARGFDKSISVSINVCLFSFSSSSQYTPQLAFALMFIPQVIIIKEASPENQNRTMLSMMSSVRTFISSFHKYLWSLCLSSCVIWKLSAMTDFYNLRFAVYISCGSVNCLGSCWCITLY